jgi:hypothetical protein
VHRGRGLGRGGAITAPGSTLRQLGELIERRGREKSVEWCDACN